MFQYFYFLDEQSNKDSKVFTPTTTAIQPQSFLCRSIETGEYLVVQRSSIKRTYDDTTEIIMNGRRTEVSIEFRGKTRESLLLRIIFHLLAPGNQRL